MDEKDDFTFLCYISLYEVHKKKRLHEGFSMKNTIQLLKSVLHINDKK